MKNYRHTIGACFVGYIVQAIVINFAPLLFVMFHEAYDIGLDRISVLITINFGCQLVLDYFSPTIIRRIGYRATGIAAQCFSALGLVFLSFLPDVLSNPYTGLLIATAFYAIGGGLDEVIISPLVELCPTTHKTGMMSLLHSFYCWGQLFTILLSTAFFLLFGMENWHLLALLWALVPAADALLFATMPMPDIPKGETQGMTRRALFGKGRFWILALLMVCGGASELCISQWASAFAQTGLGVDKTVGDLAGPCAFALLMGLSRVLYAKFAEKLNMANALFLSGVLCIGSYLLAALAKNPVLGLLGCALAGFSVGILWPCALSLGARSMRGGGVTLFALLALFGDIGCTTGPTLVGLIADAFDGKIQIGILFSLIFPVLLIIGTFLFRRSMRRGD